MKPLVLTLAALVVAISESAAETVRSPDGKVVVSVELQTGRPSWSIAYGDHRIIRDGLLGVETAPDNFCGAYRLVGTETATGDTTWKPVTPGRAPRRSGHRRKLPTSRRTWDPSGKSTRNGATT